LFARATLIGVDRSVRCALIDLSAAGAMLTVTAALPTPPLRLVVEFGGAELELPLEIRRVSTSGGVAVAFPHPHSESLHHLIAVEQRHALAQGRVNISERRVSASVRAARSEAVQPPQPSGS
jgi:hypothetical protein